MRDNFRVAVRPEHPLPSSATPTVDPLLLIVRATGFLVHGVSECGRRLTYVPATANLLRLRRELRNIQMEFSFTRMRTQSCASAIDGKIFVSQPIPSMNASHIPAKANTTFRSATSATSNPGTEYEAICQSCNTMPSI